MKKSWLENEFLSLFCNRKTAGLTFCVLCGATFLVFSSVVVTRVSGWGFVGSGPPLSLSLLFDVALSVATFVIRDRSVI